MEDLQFSIYQLIEKTTVSGERFILPTNNSFNEIENSFNYPKDKTCYKVSVQKENEYIYFVLNFGNPEPRDEKLTNVSTGKEIDNPRTNEQAELNKQVFFLYHYEKKLLYASNTQKKGVFESILSDKLQRSFSIKELFKTKEEFLNSLNQCSRVSFTHANNLFNTDSTKRHALVDLTGTDSPENFEIKAKYNNHNISNFINDLFNEHENNNIDGLIIRGFDNNNFPIVYNVNTFQQKFSIKCQKDVNGKYNNDEVRTNLINKLQ